MSGNNFRNNAGNNSGNNNGVENAFETDNPNNNGTNNATTNVVGEEDLPQLLYFRGGSHVINVPRLDVKDSTSWKDRRLANQDKRLKSIIISCLPNDTMKAVIKCATANEMWNDLILSEKVKETYTRLKILLNELENKDVKIPQVEVNDSDVEKDTKSSKEFLAKINVEFHDRALFANQKRFYKRSWRVGAARKPMDKSNETCFPHVVMYKALKAELALLAQKIEVVLKQKSEKGWLLSHLIGMKNHHLQRMRVLQQSRNLWPSLMMNPLWERLMPNQVSGLKSPWKRAKDSPIKNSHECTSDNEFVNDNHDPLPLLPKLSRVDPIGTPKVKKKAQPKTPTVPDLNGCPNAKEIWIAIERLQQGDSINIQDVKTMNKLMVDTMQVNVQFLQQLQPEWNANLLALVAATQNYPDDYYQAPEAPKPYKTHAPSPRQTTSTRSHVTTKNKGKDIVKSPSPPSESACKEDSNEEQAQMDKQIHKILGMTNILGQFRNQRTVTIAGNKEPVGTQVVQQSGIQCYNCKGFGHYAKECRSAKRVKDYEYHKKKMLLCKKEAAGI
ncbi:retrovirus-related pol polyprotein from transposon TNT 1-94 [Tanacetum coccineum]